MIRAENLREGSVAPPLLLISKVEKLNHEKIQVPAYFSLRGISLRDLSFMPGWLCVLGDPSDRGRSLFRMQPGEWASNREASADRA